MVNDTDDEKRAGHPMRAVSKCEHGYFQVDANGGVCLLLLAPKRFTRPGLRMRQMAQMFARFQRREDLRCGELTGTALLAT